MCYLLKTQKPYVSVSYSKNQSDETVSMTPEQTWSAEENQKLQEKKLPLRFSGGFCSMDLFQAKWQIQNFKTHSTKKKRVENVTLGLFVWPEWHDENLSLLLKH